MKSARAYVIASSAVFALAALVNLIRAWRGWPFQFGPWLIAPVWSWLAFVIGALLCAWGLASRRTR